MLSPDAGPGAAMAPRKPCDQEDKLPVSFQPFCFPLSVWYSINLVVVSLTVPSNSLQPHAL